MCQTCIDEPGSHSFDFVGINWDNVKMYYTCPAKASKYWDTKGILEHYKEMLEANDDHPWLWIFDGSGFGLAHSMQIATALGIVNLLKNKYGKYLTEIRIIHPSVYIKGLYNIILPFMSRELIDIVKWEV